LVTRWKVSATHVVDILEPVYLTRDFYLSCMFQSCILTLWYPLLPYRYSYKASCARPG